jgi:hypothetical protein
MLRYSDAKTFVTAGLTSLGYGTSNHPAMPAIDPGPPALPAALKVTPNSLVIVTVGNGIGLTTEGLLDRPFITVRVVGPQGDYDGAETLAQDIDGLMLAVANSMVGTTRALYVTRNAPPQLVDLDASNRYHFQTTYITETKR